MTADTVATDTPAWAATSLIVAERPDDASISFICFASSMQSDGSCPYDASSSDALTKHPAVSSCCALETREYRHWYSLASAANAEKRFVNRFANRFAAFKNIIRIVPLSSSFTQKSISLKA